MGLTYFDVRFFVGFSVVDLPLLLLLLRTSVVLRMKGGPSHSVFLVCKELCNRLGEIVVVRAL